MLDTISIDSGFSIASNVLTAAECDVLIDSISAGAVHRGRAGVRNLMGNDAVRELASDERLLSIARPFLFDTPLPYRATLFEKSGKANWLIAWHQDTAMPLERKVESAGWGPWSTKSGITYAHAPASVLERVIALRVQLDASTATNGPLRVIPGTHRSGILSDQDVYRLARANPSVDCLCPKGGVIAMRPLLIHASSKVVEDLPRRVLHIEYTNSLSVFDGVDLAVA